MKKILLILAVFLPLLIHGQTDHFSNRNAIKISPVEFGKAEFQLAYERYFGDRSSSLIINPSVILQETRFETKEGFQIGAQYRFFLTHIRSDEQKVFLGMHNIGFYAGLYGHYQDYSEDYQFSWWDNTTNMQFSDEFNKKVTASEGGAIIGVQIDITKRILLDFFVGGGIRYTDITDSKDGVVPSDSFYEEYGVFDIEYQGVKPKIGFQLGILF